MNDLPTPKKFSRRETLVAGASGAGLLGFAIASQGCVPLDMTEIGDKQPPSDSQEKDNKSIQSNSRVQDEYRIYGVAITNPDETRMFSKNLPIAPSHCISYSLGAQLQSDFHYAVWATEEEAKAFEQFPSVRLIKVTPETIFEMGDLKSERVSKVAVKFFPATQESTWKERPCEGLEQIAAKWRDAFAKLGAKVTLTKPQQPGPSKAIDKLVEANQILIEFSKRVPKSEVSKIVKTHPQTLMLQWGEAYTYCYCPGCGMG